MEATKTYPETTWLMVAKKKKRWEDAQLITPKKVKVFTLMKRHGREPVAGSRNWPAKHAYRLSESTKLIFRAAPRHCIPQHHKQTPRCRSRGTWHNLFINRWIKYYTRPGTLRKPSIFADRTVRILCRKRFANGPIGDGQPLLRH